MLTIRNSPQVIVNSVCPGIVATDLARQTTEASRVIRFLLPVAFAAAFQTPEVGSRIYAKAGLVSAEDHVSDPLTQTETKAEPPPIPRSNDVSRD